MPSAPLFLEEREIPQRGGSLGIANVLRAFRIWPDVMVDQKKRRLRLG